MPVDRIVLVVVHTVTAWNRLADLISVFGADRRVQLVYTIPGASAAEFGVAEELMRAEVVVLPWDQAVMTSFDLAIAVHHSGNLDDIPGPLALISHGIGYSKRATSNEQRATSNEQRATSNEQRATSNEAYGLSAEWLVRGGAVVPHAVVLAHDSERDRLARVVPTAVSAAVVAGDPCWDRLQASRDRRHEFRAALDAHEQSRVVLVSSTWGPRSLFGRHPDLVGRLRAEADLDTIVCVVLHPNTWFAHGPGQIRLWLADAIRAGVRVVPPARGWQQALLAADVVVGDHGAVTGYAAAQGVPTTLATFPDQDVVAASAIGALGRAAPRLDHARPLDPQLRAIEANAPETDAVRELVSSAPGDAARRLRQVFYRLMALPEPTAGAPVHPYPARDLVPSWEEPRAWWTHAEVSGRHRVTVRCWAADVPLTVGDPLEELDRYLVVAADHPRRDLLGIAAVLLVGVQPDPTSVLAAHPACRWVVRPVGSDDHEAVARSGMRLVLRASGNAAPTISAASAVSAISAWLGSGNDLPDRLDVMHGTQTMSLTIRRSG